MDGDMLTMSRNRGKYNSISSFSWGLGLSLGAASGGILADLLGWRWIFGIQVPFLTMLPILSWFTVPEDLGRAGSVKHTLREAFASFDYLGTGLITVSATSFVLLASIGGNVVPWTHPLVVASAVAVVVTGIAFVRVEQTATKPVYPLQLFAGRPFAQLYGGTFIMSGVQTALYFTVPIFFQAVRLTSATTSGLQIMSPTVANMVIGAATSLAIGKWGHLSPWNRAGACFMTFGALLACFYDARWPHWAFYLALSPVGIAAGVFWPATTIATVAYTPQRDQPATSGLMFLTRGIANIGGVAASSLVLQNALATYLDEYVQGPDKVDIVNRARSSVEAVRLMPAPYQEQVMQSYDGACRVAFWFIFGLVVWVLPIILPLRLTRIGGPK